MKRYMGQLLQFQHQEQVSHLQSIERGVAQVVWFLFVFLLPWCLCHSLLNLQEPYSEEQVWP